MVGHSLAGKHLITDSLETVLFKLDLRGSLMIKKNHYLKVKHKYHK